MRPRVSAVRLAALVLALASPAAALAQLAPSPHAPPLPPVPEVDGPLAVSVVYPLANQAVMARDSTFIFGSVGTGRAGLTINGAPVVVAPDGAFLAWLPLPDDTMAVFHIVAVAGAASAALDWPVRLPPRFDPPPGRALWLDTASMRPRGRIWGEPGEPIRVSARAAPGASVAVRLPDGRLVPLAPDTGAATPYGPFERRPDRLAPVPVVRFVGTIPAVPLGAPLPALTARDGAADSGAGATTAALVVAHGADTVTTAVPVRVALVDPAAPQVVVLAAEAGPNDSGRSSVVASPTPGGTYHWFFPSGTPAQLDGRVGDQVRVRLSAASAAWVALSDVAALLPAGTPPPATTVRLVRLTPRASSVEARFALGARVPFRVDEDDRTITVLLYGAASDLDFVQYGGADPLVRRVTWAQPASDECTVTFELSAPVFGWRPRWEGRDLVLEIRRPPVIDRARPLAGLTVAVDPGHPPLGATGPTGLKESDATLAVGLALRALLEREGARVVMTRTADSALGLYPRTAIAERADADVLVSIHLNALPDGVNPFANNGTSTYYFFPRASRLAMLTQQALVGELGLRDLGAARGDFALVRTSWMPSILTEGAFLMMPEQESALRTPAFRAAYARGIVLGLEAYFRELAGQVP
jgi:N-acetylmuramoyl-L-alanine amidase